MINLELFQRSQIFQEENTPWRKLFQVTINSEIDKICSRGPEYILSLKQKSDNKIFVTYF